MPEDPLTTIADATREVAKATGKGIDAASGIGRFFDKVFGDALQECGGALADKVRYWRLARLLRLQRQYESQCDFLGKDRESKPVEPKFAFALLEAASLEDNDDLQDMFARLLANATTAGTGVEARKMYVSILSELSPLDATMLNIIYSAQPADFEGRPDDFAIHIGHLPGEVVYYKNHIINPPPLIDKKIEISIWNLVRLGCIESASLGGPSSIRYILITQLGRAVMEACTPLQNAVRS